MTMPHSNTVETDVAIIGAGPVGLFAVFELGMLNIKAQLIDTLPAIGGQCTALYPEKPIYDIPGFPSVDGADLIRHLEAQAAPFAPVYHLGQQVMQCSRIDAEEGLAPHASLPPAASGSPSATQPLSRARWRLVTDKGTVIDAKAVVIAAGCGAFGPNRPPLEGIEQYEGTNVHYMVARREDFRGQTLVIAGGGDSAVDWANSLGALAKKIYFVHRRDKFRAMPESLARLKLLEDAGKVEMVIPYQLESLAGENGKLRAVGVKSMDGAVRELEADHLLAFFGLRMELGPIAEWGLNLSGSHVAVEPGTQCTNAPGIFAIGDIASYPHKLKLILCGFAEAAQAAHAIRGLVYPGVAHHFQYSTSMGLPAL